MKGKPKKGAVPPALANYMKKKKPAKAKMPKGK